MKCFCGMADQLKAFSLICKFLAGTIVRDPHHQIFDMSWAGFEPALKLISGLIESICVVVITPLQHGDVLVLCCPLFLKNISTPRSGKYTWLTKTEWSSGLRCCDYNQKIAGSNTTRRSYGIRDSTWLWGSRWPSSEDRCID